MKKVTLLSVLILSATTAAPVFAAEHGVDRSLAATRQEMRASLIEIEGTLKCDAGDKNTGEACALSIQDNKTGRSYHLSGSKDAMALYQSGHKNVAIEAERGDDDTLAVRTTRAL